jgi:hypothetical protein
VNSVPLSLTNDHARATPHLDDVIKFALHPQRGQRCVHHQAQAFPGEVVDHGQDAEAPTARERVYHKVERPAQVLILRDRHRRPGAQCSFAATALAHRQPFLFVDPVQLLVIDPNPLPSQ